LVKVVRKKNNAPKSLALELKNLCKNIDYATYNIALCFAYLHGDRYFKANNNWYRAEGAKVVIKKGLK
jgi:hypothetical protein